jgi:hypothetical protein
MTPQKGLLIPKNYCLCASPRDSGNVFFRIFLPRVLGVENIENVVVSSPADSHIKAFLELNSPAWGRT